MSVKINLSSLIREHYKTLKNDDKNRLSFVDFFTFTIIPVALCVLSIYFDLKINTEFRGALINFGAIFSALLMSVLVLVYDQENKLTERKLLVDKLKKQDIDDYVDIVNYADKKELLGQLYHNICFAIIVSLSIVVFPMLQIVASGFNCTLLNQWLINPIIVFTLYSMILTTLMIVKRMHSLLCTNLVND
jgi:hypothetical protein